MDPLNRSRLFFPVKRRRGGELPHSVPLLMFHLYLHQTPMFPPFFSFAGPSSAEFLPFLLPVDTPTELVFFSLPFLRTAMSSSFIQDRAGLVLHRFLHSSFLLLHVRALPSLLPPPPILNLVGLLSVSLFQE